MNTQFKTTGSKYDSTLGIKDIAKLIKKELKTKYPKCKFSVRISRYSGGQSLDVSLMSSNFNPFATPNEEVANTPHIKRNMYSAEEILDMWQKHIDDGSHSLNQFYIDDDYMLNDKGKALAKTMVQVVNQYNFDDSDSMVDYFHVNFYSNFEIGRWDSPLVITQ